MNTISLAINSYSFYTILNTIYDHEVDHSYMYKQAYIASSQILKRRKALKKKRGKIRKIKAKREKASVPFLTSQHNLSRKRKVRRKKERK